MAKKDMHKEDKGDQASKGYRKLGSMGPEAENHMIRDAHEQKEEVTSDLGMYHQSNSHQPFYSDSKKK